jgi:parvulin-like peptidyl-prolyl isomerase
MAGMLLHTLVAARAAWAQENKDTTKEVPPLAATVDGEPVYVGEVDVLVYNLQKTRQVVPAGLNKARAEILNQVINRRLAERAIRREGTFVTKAQIDKEIDKIKTQAYGMRLSLDQYVAKRRITVDVLRHEVGWNIGWAKYLEAKLGEALEGYFNEHRKELDGTLVRASHILLRSDRFNESVPQLLARAEKVREEIESGTITFEQAAEKYSAGPSRHTKGDLGYFPRYAVMTEDFSKAAFDLKKDELSKPLATAFGVHLIKVTDVKPGTKQWTESAAQLKSPASIDLFDKLVKKERESAKIEFTGKCPYLKPDTNELVLPARSSQ